MPFDRCKHVLAGELEALHQQGTAKGSETEVTHVLPATAEQGPRFHLEGQGTKEFIRMNSNSYLGLSFRDELLHAEDGASRKYGVGPGAVRFISGTYSPHLELERALAEFHGREAGMIFSSAYATTLGVLVPLIDKETVVVSDELNHNCIINAMRLSRPAAKFIYKHNDMADLEAKLSEAVGKGKRAVLVTDGIFSMRGDHAPLVEVNALARRFDEHFPENVVVMIDDSHGVGSFGQTGRGTEEYTGAPHSDILVGTLGKAFCVNGGYVVGDRVLIDYLREKAATYIYSNPITCGEAAAALAAVQLVDEPSGQALLANLRAMTQKFETGLVELGFETIPGEHPVVPLMVRDTERTDALVRHLFANGVLATGLNFPVVPKGDEEIRFQVNADHTAKDIDEVLRVLSTFE